MPQHQAVASPLDVGQHSFGAFLDEFFGKIKDDLLRECSRIVAARELLLKKKLNDVHMQNEDLRAKLKKATKIAGDGALSSRDSKLRQSYLQDTTQLVSPDLDLIESELEVDISSLMNESPEGSSLIPSNDHHGKSESFTLWGEWRDLERDECADELHCLEADENEHWDRGPGKEFRNMHKSWCTASPNSTAFICWEVFGIPILFYDLVMIPMQVFHDFTGIVFDFIGWVLILYWTIDLLLRLLIVGHVTPEGIIKLDRKVFMNMYLRRAFAFDFLLVAPDWFSKSVGAVGMRNVAVLRLLRVLRLMRLMRMTKMKRLFRDLEDVIDSEYFTVLVSIWVNLFAILGMCHYLACFWFWVGSIEVPGEPSWVEEHFQGAKWEYQYVMSLHWAIAQFTPGSSRIQPRNILEASGGIATLVFGLIFLSLFISALSQARMRLQAITSKVDRDNWILRRYLRQQGVSTDLQVRTMRYVERCLEPMFSRVQRKDVYLLPLLSKPLQLEVQEEQYFHTLIAHPLLKTLRQRSLSLILHLFLNVIVEIYLADGDILFEFGNISHEMYFVSRGALLYLLHGGKDINYVDVGNWCCEAVLWVEWVHKGSAKATSESQAISVDSAKLRAAVLDHKEKSYIGRCACAYYKDLNALTDRGKVITDLTVITEDACSAYIEAICGKSVGVGRQSLSL